VFPQWKGQEAKLQEMFKLEIDLDGAEETSEGRLAVPLRLRVRDPKDKHLLDNNEVRLPDPQLELEKKGS
jgi:hypothetical protein